MKRQYCPRCGVPLPPDGSACYSCGWTEKHAAAGSPYVSAPEVSSSDKGLLSGKQRSEEAAAEAGAPRRTVLQTIFGLICGMVVLAALGITTYIMLMGNMFVRDGTPLDPVTMSPAEGGSYGLVAQANELLRFFMEDMVGMFTDLLDAGSIQQLIGFILRILITGLYIVAAAIIAIAAVAAVIRFIVGMARGRNFSMASFAAVQLGAVGMVWFAGRMSGYGDVVGSGSGTFTCLLLAVCALAACLLYNIVFAGKRLIKFGSLLKLITNAGIFACSAVCLLSFPFAISASYDGTSAEVIGGAINIASGFVNGGESADIPLLGIVYMAALLVLTLKYVFTLPFFVGKTASRLAKTFKFDGYKDKGFIYRSLLFLIGGVIFAVFGIMYLSDTGAQPSTDFIAFCISVAAVFVLAILNRMCLNRDQI